MQGLTNYVGNWEMGEVLCITWIGFWVNESILIRIMFRGEKVFGMEFFIMPFLYRERQRSMYVYLYLKKILNINLRLGDKDSMILLAMLLHIFSLVKYCNIFCLLLHIHKREDKNCALLFRWEMGGGGDHVVCKLPLTS